MVKELVDIDRLEKGYRIKLKEYELNYKISKTQSDIEAYYNFFIAFGVGLLVLYLTVDVTFNPPWTWVVFILIVLAVGGWFCNNKIEELKRNREKSYNQITGKIKMIMKE